MTTEQLQLMLAQYTGTNHYYHLPLWGKHSLNYTDGIRAMCKIAYDSSDGNLINSNGEQGADVTIELDYTDFPEGVFEFYILDKIAMLKSEY